MADDDEDDDFAAHTDRQTVLRQNFAAGVATVLDANDSASRLPTSTGFATALTEIAWTWSTTALAPDLEAFARHAKRAKVGVEDVLLAARKNEVSHALVEREGQKLRSLRNKADDGSKGVAKGAGRQ